MCRNVALGALAPLIVGLAASVVQGQDTMLAQLYGNGVHAFFAGDYEKAHKLLTSAIEQGSQDPRCYYFRGLAYSRLGRPNEAAADYAMGAELEMTSDDRFYAVSESLERVQGFDRLKLEENRQAARLAAHERALKRQRARYEQLRLAEEEVLRGVSRPAPTNVPDLPAAAQPDPTDPFSQEAGAAKAAEGQPQAAAAPEPAPAKPEAAAAPAETETPNPFQVPAKPIEEKPAEEKPAEPDPLATPVKPTQAEASDAAPKPTEGGAAASIFRALGNAIRGDDTATEKGGAPPAVPGGQPAQEPPAKEAPKPAEEGDAANPFGPNPFVTPPQPEAPAKPAPPAKPKPSAEKKAQ